MGKLYIAGAQPDISKLYTPISFPVCLGNTDDRIFRDPQTTASQRQQIQTRPKYERYVFIPYENPRSLDLKDPINGKVHALTVLLQIVRENTTTLKIKAMEVAGNRAASSLLAPLVLDIIYDETLFDVSTHYKILWTQS